MPPKRFFCPVMRAPACVPGFLLFLREKPTREARAGGREGNREPSQRHSVLSPAANSEGGLKMLQPTIRALYSTSPPHHKRLVPLLGSKRGAA